MTRHGIVALALIILLGAAFAAALTLPAVHRYDAALEAKAAAEQQSVALAQRLATLAAEQISSTGAELSTFDVIVSNSASEADDQLQALVLSLTNQAGVTLSTFRSLALSPLAEQPRRGIEIETLAAYADVLALLAALEQAQPHLGVSHLMIRQEPVYDSPPAITPVYAQLEIWAYWDSPEAPVGSEP